MGHIAVGVIESQHSCWVLLRLALDLSLFWIKKCLAASHDASVRNSMRCFPWCLFFFFNIHHWWTFSKTCKHSKKCLKSLITFRLWWKCPVEDEAWNVPCLKEALAKWCVDVLVQTVIFQCFLTYTLSVWHEFVNLSICSRRQWKSRWVQTFRRGKSRSCVSRDRSSVYFIRYTAPQ